MRDKPIVASEGMIMTDGEIYGRKIFLAEGRSAEEFYEIPLEEYEQMMEQEVLQDGGTEAEG